MQEAGVGTDGRRLLGTRNTIAEEAMQGVGWRKLEERREEMKVLLDKRLEGIEESRLVKMVVEKKREDRGIRWWEEYEVFRRKFELDNEGGLVGKLKNKIKTRNEKDWDEV